MKYNCLLLSPASPSFRNQLFVLFFFASIICHATAGKLYAGVVCDNLSNGRVSSRFILNQIDVDSGSMSRVAWFDMGYYINDKQTWFQLPNSAVDYKSNIIYVVTNSSVVGIDVTRRRVMSHANKTIHYSIPTMLDFNQQTSLIQAVPAFHYGTINPKTAEFKKTINLEEFFGSYTFASAMDSSAQVQYFVAGNSRSNSNFSTNCDAFSKSNCWVAIDTTSNQFKSVTSMQKDLSPSFISKQLNSNGDYVSNSYNFAKRQEEVGTINPATGGYQTSDRLTSPPIYTFRNTFDVDSNSMFYVDNQWFANKQKQLIVVNSNTGAQISNSSLSAFNRDLCSLSPQNYQVATLDWLP